MIKQKEQGKRTSVTVKDEAVEVLPAPKKAKPVKKDRPSTKYGLKRLQMRERKEAQVTKKIRRKMAALEKRREDKSTREELLAELLQLQLAPAESARLASVTQLKRKGATKAQRKRDLDPCAYVEPEDDSAEFHVVKKKIKLNPTSNVTPTVNTYYSTDSGSSESEEEDEDEDEMQVEPKEEIDEEDVKLEEPLSRLEDFKPANNDAIKVAAKKESPLIQAKEKPLRSSLPSNGLKPVLIHSRDPAVEAQRMKLPIYSEEQSIVEAINENLVTIINGETGSGKTTQVPQFLYEAGYTSRGLIGITEPRRVAAVCMAKRVGIELGLPNVSSYQIRYEGNRTDETRILFMTDGVLLKEMQTDIMLKKYSVIIIDEAHERSMYSDVLIGILSRIVISRAESNPLKLILMSATLLESDFVHTRLFPTITPKVLTVQSRQFPVSVHFEKRTPQDFVVAAFKKICRIHEQLPNGGILVFVPSQSDIFLLINKLTARYPNNSQETCNDDFEDNNYSSTSRKHHKPSILDEEDLLENENAGGADEMNDEMDIHDFSDQMMPPTSKQPLYCLPLFSLLSNEKQRLVFEDPPEGTRLCVVATNIAETSITIPGIRYVVDTGFEKRRLYDPVTGVSQFVVARCSQASADQRLGRAGRVCAGHAYRLFSSQVYNDMCKFSRPEILDKPPDQLVLLLKSMNIVKVVNFPFPTAPDADALQAAETRLVNLGALKVSVQKDKSEARVTPLGLSLSVFPLSPPYAKVITMANQFDLMQYVIAIISALSVREPLINLASLCHPVQENARQRIIETLKLRRTWVGKGSSRRLADLAVLLMAVLESEKCNMKIEECEGLGIRPKAMQEIRKVRRQLTKIVNDTFSIATTFEPKLQPISDKQSNLLRQILIACLPDKVARRVTLENAEDHEDIPKGAYQSQHLKEYVFLDPTSMLYTEEPDYVLFQEIVQVKDKFCMQNVMAADEDWLVQLAAGHCQFGEIAKDSEIRYSETEDALVSEVPVYFGPLRWQLKRTERSLPKNLQTYRYFAQFLLDGKILPGFARYSDKLLAPPVTMTREWARLQQRTETFLNALIKKEILSRGALLSTWKTEPSFLLNEFLDWVPSSLHSKVQLEWPLK